ncbi:nitrogenase component 1 [Methanococcus voltae]|uniref:Nitrogenase molybdenum-cofactor synthesis protein NifE n=1 Tax=Methanococcus voltae TaxID=2188 RepID=A0A8J7UUG8_METVO|nr:nitrogenase component 1 [Methanococcus voltae]MBP2171746.1 nitrogenase molybdenum-cofactor synthesis protein NifE [Methanococcus voltae]MBP2201316.1 nitrogenase molybdenum-cofactor synthesis protein NifE [Methanococcus voltae]
MKKDNLNDETTKNRIKKDILSYTLRDHLFNGIRQHSNWQYHKYGINCKLSGALNTAVELENSKVIVHGCSHCAFNQRLSPRTMYDPAYDVECTNMTEKDVIYGGEEKLRAKIIEVYEKYHPKIITVLPSCIPGLIMDDITGVIATLNDEDILKDCKLVYVSSEGFSHRAKNAFERVMKDYTKAWKNPKDVPNYEIRGCGKQEALYSFFKQLYTLKEYNNDKNNDKFDSSKVVNIESIGLQGFVNKLEVENISKILKRASIDVNLIPTNLEHCKNASSADLNVVMGNIRWAERMKQEFGIKYVKKWFYHYGIEGTEQFFNEIFEEIGLEEEELINAKQIVKEEKEKAVDKLKDYSEFLGKYKYAVYTSGFFTTPYILKIYLEDYGLPIKYVLLDTKSLKNLNISDETIDETVESIQKLFDEWNYDIKIVLNPEIEELNDVAENVDYILGDRHLPYIENIPIINLHLVSSFLYRSSFDLLTEFSKYMVRKIKIKQNSKYQVDNSKLIISNFDYDKVHYPLLDEEVPRNSMKIWREIWAIKSE